MQVDPLDRRIPEDKLQIWLEKVRAARTDSEREAAMECYFDTVLPDVIEGLESEPSHHTLRNDGFDTLISLMGFSPETTVICAAVVRPKKLLVIYGAPDDEKERRKVQFSFGIAHRFLTSRGILDEAQIHHQVINPTDPIDIYKAIREAIDKTPTINDNKSALVDITGGKKVMSATAGQSAWETRLPLCYVEGKFEPTLRRPWPGTELVMKLQNPSLQEQLQMRIDALNLYSKRNYPQAVDAFDTCEANRVENRLDVFASALCRAYVRWTDLDLPRLKSDVETVRRRLNEPRLTRLFADRQQPRDPLFQRLDALVRVADAEPLAMIATYHQLADLYHTDAFQRFDFACLLVYRGMEATVEYGLRQLAGADFDMSDPDWTLLGDEADLKTQYVALSEKLDKRREAENSLPKRIGFVNGLGLLCIAGRIHERAGLQEVELVNQMRSVARKRNESVLAHGTRTLAAADYHDMKDKADKLADWVLGESNNQIKELRAALEPIDLEPLHDPTQY